MKKQLGVRLFLAALVLAALADFLIRPLLVVESEQGAILYFERAYAGMPVEIHFIHSVQKTPVEENLHVDDELVGFVLDSTRYQSFGVGLPFLASEGQFRAEGDHFVMDGMERRFPRLSLRTGVGTELTLVLDGTEERLFEKLEPGSRIDLAVMPPWQWGMEKLFGKAHGAANAARKE